MKDQSLPNNNVANDQQQSEDAKSSKLKRSYEISDEAKEERRQLAAFLLGKKEELIQERNKRKKKQEAETIELRSGKTISILEIKQFVSSLKRKPFVPLFPNDNPFFGHMFRLHPKLQGHDPKKYEKPYLAGKLLKKLTYRRFSSEFSIDVLPALVVLAMPDGVRINKCHEYLTDEGVLHITRYRNDANNMMKNFKDLDWYSFDKKYSETYKLPFQPRLPI